MADVADLAQERAEREEPYLLAANRRPTGPAAKSSCHYCDEPLAGAMRWCGVQCRDEWQREQGRRG